MSDKYLYSLADREIHSVILENNSSMTVSVMNYGGRITSLGVPDRYGVSRNVVLSYASPEDYLTDPYYLGAVIGPVANRISSARFSLEGKEYLMDMNDGRNCNHSGSIGLHRQVWDIARATKDTVVMSYHIRASGGFCSDIVFTASYMLSDENCLTVEYNATPVGLAPVDMTNHMYFNLSGSPDISSHELEICSSSFLEMDGAYIPTSRILDASGPYSYRNMKKVGCRPLNRYYISDRQSSYARLYAPESGIEVIMESNRPGVLVYSGFCLDRPFVPYQGICLEFQGYPDALSNSTFPSILVNPGDTYVYRTIYRFETHLYSE